MAGFRQIVETAREYMGNMAASQKLLLASLAVIAAMTYFVVTQYTGSAKMVELSLSAEGGSEQQTMAILNQVGIKAKLSPGGKVMVPAQMHNAAVAQLAEQGALPNDTSLLFSNLLDRQGFYYSKQQNEQAFNIALQNELARMIRNFSSIKDATVVIDAPEPQGIGRAVRQATASASVRTTTGRPLSQGEVDAIAELISGAKAGLKIENVRVIDLAAGRQRRPTNPDEALPTTYLEHASAIEAKLQRKLSDMLSYIPGVTIAVTAHVDVTRVNQQSTKYFKDKEGSVQIASRVKTDSTTQTGASKAAAPGVRSNAQGSILSSSSGGSGNSLSEEGGETEFATGLGSQTTTLSDPRGNPTLLAASVNVPRSYIAMLIKNESGTADDGSDTSGNGTDGATEPTEAQIEARFEKEKVKIEESIQPHLTASDENGDVQGKVVVSLIPLDVPLPGSGVSQAGLLGGLAGGSGGGGLLGGGLVEKGLLALLAVGALGMMLMMVKKATKPAELPSAEELSGVPPTLPTVNDMVGEADESEAPMTGIEIGDNEVRTRKLVEQVEELVGSNPDSAASLLHRWIGEDE